MKVILLLGPSTAGKTTLCQVLKEKHQCQIVGVDGVADGLLFAQKQNVERLLRENHLMEPLASIMSAEQVTHLAMTGHIKINRADFKGHQFENPSFPRLEEVLAHAGVEAETIPHQAKLLREASALVDKYLKENLLSPEQIIPETLNQAFKYRPGETVVIDIVPGPQMGPQQMKKLLEQKAKKYQEETKESVEAIVVLAVCSPQMLSDRLLQRNFEANRDSKFANIRRGLFPLHQLLHIIGGDSEEKAGQNKWRALLTRAEAFEIARTHSLPPRREQNKCSDPVDPLAMVPVSSDGKKIHYKVGPWSVVQEYRHLIRKTGMKEEQSMISLAIRPDIQYDIVLQMQTKSPQDIAAELVEEIARHSSGSPKSLVSP